MDQNVSFIPPPQPKTSHGASAMIVILGVVFPILGLGVELFSHLCAETFFNPIPSVGHGILIAMVPGLNLWGWLILRKQGDISSRYYNTLLWANGFAVGISIYYSLIFFPITFISLLLIGFFGLGLLGLAPLFSLVGGLYLRQRLKEWKNTKERGLGVKPWWGMVAAILLLVSFDAPVTITRIGLSLAGSESISTHRRGVSLLRSLGSREQMLRACYERPVYTADLVGTLCNVFNPVNPEEARKIYYQVTGATFNSVPPPRLTGRGAWDSDEWFWDVDQGGQKVAAVIKGLSLSGSRLDTSIDPEAAVTYSEWTLAFTNQSRLQREARTQILLPPGGVISRLTLWVDGEEREAAFAKRSEVRAAYQKVVQARRDPVLVTATGPNRILLQCFPVPPSGGTMKVRIGITAPLMLDASLAKGELFLPTFVEKNFMIPDTLNHAVWIESGQKLSSDFKSLRRITTGEGAIAIMGNINDRDLPERIGVTAERNPRITSAFTANPSGQGLILQRMVADYEPPMKRFILVIDGSAALRGFDGPLTEMLKVLPDSAGLDLIVADDEVRTQRFPPDPERNAVVKTWIKQTRFTGGKDNLPALLKAVEMADEDQNSVILWVHGPQPVLFTAPDALEQWFDRNPDAAHINEYEVTPGQNLIVEELGYRMSSVKWSGNLKEDLSQFLGVAMGRSKGVKLVWEVSRNTPQGENVVRTSKHLARLWANDQVGKLIQNGKPKDLEEAAKIAATYQIVTAVSGAVVLESQAQYQDAGLKPVDPGSVPTVPEPETALLLLVAGLLCGCGLWLKARLRRVACG